MLKQVDLEKDEIVEHKFKFWNVEVYLTNKRLILERKIALGERLQSCHYKDISLVHLVEKGFTFPTSLGYTALVVLLTTWFIWDLLKTLELLPSYIEHVFLVVIVVFGAMLIYGALDVAVAGVANHAWIEIYVSGRKKPLRIRGKKRELEKALKIIRKTIRRRQ